MSRLDIGFKLADLILKIGDETMGKIASYIINMLPYMLFALPIIIIFRATRTKYMKKELMKTTLWHEIGLITFLLLLIGLASQTIIPKIEFGNSAQMFVSTGMGEINLYPFKVIPETYKAIFVDDYINYFLINFVGNIVIFMPIGFFIPLLWHKISFKKTVFIRFLTSLFIELCQLPQSRGTDIDDLWINTLGAVAGYAVFVLFKKSFKDFSNKFKVTAEQEYNR